jgi:hypothetical protein
VSSFSLTNSIAALIASVTPTPKTIVKTPVPICLTSAFQFVCWDGVGFSGGVNVLTELPWIKVADIKLVNNDPDLPIKLNV